MTEQSKIPKEILDKIEKRMRKLQEGTEAIEVGEEKEESEIPLPEERVASETKGAGNRFKNFIKDWARYIKGEVKEEKPEESKIEETKKEKKSLIKSGALGLLNLTGTLTGTKFAHDAYVGVCQRYFTGKERERIKEVLSEKRPDEKENAIENKNEELMRIIAESKYLTKEKSEKLQEKIYEILQKNSSESKVIENEAKKEIAKLIDESIQETVKGSTIAKEGFNTLFMLSGLSLFRGVMYGGISMAERWRNFTKKSKEKGEEKVGFQAHLKDLFINATKETFYSNIREAETNKEKAIAFGKAGMATARIAGFVGLGISEIEHEGVSGAVEKFFDKMSEIKSPEELWQFGSENFMDGLHRLTLGIFRGNPPGEDIELDWKLEQQLKSEGISRNIAERVAGEDGFLSESQLDNLRKINEQLKNLRVESTYARESAMDILFQDGTLDPNDSQVLAGIEDKLNNLEINENAKQAEIVAAIVKDGLNVEDLRILDSLKENLSKIGLTDDSEQAKIVMEMAKDGFSPEELNSLERVAKLNPKFLESHRENILAMMEDGFSDQEIGELEFRSEHRILDKLADGKGTEINIDDTGKISLRMEIGEKGEFEYLDQGLRRIVMDKMPKEFIEDGKFNALEAAKVENVLANLRELIQGKEVAGFEVDDFKELVEFEDGELNIKNYAGFEEELDELFVHSNKIINQQSEALAYVNNTSQEDWQKIIEDKGLENVEVEDFNKDQLVKNAKEVIRQRELERVREEIAKTAEPKLETAELEPEKRPSEITPLETAELEPEKSPLPGEGEPLLKEEEIEAEQERMLTEKEEIIQKEKMPLLDELEFPASSQEGVILKEKMPLLDELEFPASSQEGIIPEEKMPLLDEPEFSALENVKRMPFDQQQAVIEETKNALTQTTTRDETWQEKAELLNQIENNPERIEEVIERTERELSEALKAGDLESVTINLEEAVKSQVVFAGLDDQATEAYKQIVIMEGDGDLIKGLKHRLGENPDEEILKNDVENFINETMRKKVPGDADWHPRRIWDPISEKFKTVLMRQKTEGRIQIDTDFDGNPNHFGGIRIGPFRLGGIEHSLKKIEKMFYPPAQ